MRMQFMLKTARATALSIVLVAAMAAAMPADVPHFALSKSAPEADASVDAPTEIRLWFTQEPQEGTTQIRLVEADDAGVHVGDIMQDGDDPLSFSVELHGTLAAGTYTVSWRGMGADGHVVRDDFEFTVAAN
jgi:methionine-rich copper-binding protein CopC